MKVSLSRVPKMNKHKEFRVPGWALSHTHPKVMVPHAFILTDMCCALTDGMQNSSPIPHADSVFVVLKDHDEIQNAILLLKVLLESTGILIALWCNAVVSGPNVASLSYWGDFEARNPLCGPCDLLVFHVLRSVDLVFCPAGFSFSYSGDSMARNHLCRPRLLSCVFKQFSSSGGFVTRNPLCGPCSPSCLSFIWLLSWSWPGTVDLAYCPICYLTDWQPGTIC